MSDLSFEQKFGQLADAQINEKVPALVAHRIGFQVIDKDEDETRAIGVAAFILNDVWLYIPVFFLKGTLKGFDLLYIKQRDIFIPARDNWIMMLRERGMKILGKGQGSGRSAAGYGGYGGSTDYGNMDSFYGPEQISTYNNTYGFNQNKYGNLDLGDGSLIDEETFKLMTLPRGAYQPVDLGRDIPAFGKAAVDTFVHTLIREPEFANAVFRYYSVAQLQKLALDMVEGLPGIPAENGKPVSFIMTPRVRQGLSKEALQIVEDGGTQILDSTSKEAQELDDQEKQLLSRNGVYVVDQRVNTSQVFQREQDTGVLQNPTFAGVHDIFLQDGTYKTMIVLFPKCYVEDPQAFRQDSGDTNAGRPVALIDVDEPSRYIKTVNRRVFCKPSTQLTMEQMQGIQGGQAATLRTILDKPKGTYLLFVERPGRVVETILLGQDTDVGGNAYVAVQNTSGHMYPEPVAGNVPGRIILEFTDRPGKLRRYGDKLFIPRGTRVFFMEPGANRNLAFAGAETAYQIMHKTAGLHILRIHSQGGSAEITGADGSSGLLSSKIAALDCLINDHGIKAGLAQQLLKEAERDKDNVREVFIKYAAPLRPRRDYGDSMAPDESGPYPRYQYAKRYYTSTKRGKALTGPQDASNNPILPAQAIQKAVGAANAGIKEVFDVSVLSSLVDVADLSELRKDYLTDMIKGMDRVGRMLFLLYWHSEDFEDRYGEQDITKLEDTMKQVFTALGDLILFLKEKTVFSPETAESLMGSLSEEIGASS